MVQFHLHTCLLVTSQEILVSKISTINKNENDDKVASMFFQVAYLQQNGKKNLPNLSKGPMADSSNYQFPVPPTGQNPRHLALQLMNNPATFTSLQMWYPITWF